MRLVIERGDAGADPLAFSRDEQSSWLRHAALHDLCLLVIAAGDALEIFTTSRDRLAALRPVLASLKARLKVQPMAGKTPTKELTGAAAERLLSRAAGLVPAGTDGDEATVRAAATLPAAFGTLESTLGTLCWAAATVTQRVCEEPGRSSEGSGGRASAERIVEEELARWRSELAELRRSWPPGPTQEPADRFRTDEPGSLIRVKVPQALLGLADTSEQKRRA